MCSEEKCCKKNLRERTKHIEKATIIKTARQPTNKKKKSEKREKTIVKMEIKDRYDVLRFFFLLFLTKRRTYCTHIVV